MTDTLLKVRPLDIMTTLRHLITIMGLLLFLCGGCGRPPAPQSAVGSAPPVLKIAVSANGQLTVDGKASTVQALQKLLLHLSEQHGAVWYYRETGHQNPPPIAMDVMKALVEAQVPIRFSSRPDYSDTIDADGRPIAK